MARPIYTNSKYVKYEDGPGNEAKRIPSDKMASFKVLVDSIKKRFNTKTEAYKFIGLSKRPISELECGERITICYAKRIIEAYNKAKLMPIINEVKHV